MVSGFIFMQATGTNLYMLKRAMAKEIVKLAEENYDLLKMKWYEFFH